MGNTIESKISLAKEVNTRKNKAVIVALILTVAVIIWGSGVYFIVPSWTVSTVFNTSEKNTADEEDTPDDHKTAIAQRDVFKQQLKKFQAEIEPALSAASADKWAANEYIDIFKHKEKALRAFDAGNYSSAVALLRDAFEIADNVLQLAEEKFRLYMDAAGRAFESEDAGTAQASITQALLLKPDDPAARALEARIAVLPEVLRLLALINKARAENDIESWKIYLGKVIHLDPQREGLKAQLRKVTAEAASQEFSAYIADGMEAVRNRDLNVAQGFLLQASKIHPTKDETVLLHHNVQRLEREIAVQKYLDAAHKAVAEDDWASAYTYFKQARAVDNTDATAAKGVKLAMQILNVHKSIANYLAQPQRLSSENVAVAARAILQQAENLYEESLSLASQGRALAAMITEYGTPLDVIIYSDNKTDILVRGVGKVGKVLKKTVSLKPGTYTFEGKRVGYRSKLIRLEVRREGKSPEVMLVCDEPV